MIGIKYRYEVIDDSKLKLAPTKGTIIATIALTAVSMVPALVLAAQERKLSKDSPFDLIDTEPIIHPSQR